MNLVIVEVVIGLSFLFFVISIVSSAVQEAIASVFKLRARKLELGVINLLTGKSITLQHALNDPNVSEETVPTGDGPNAADASNAAGNVGNMLTSFFEHSLIAGYRDGSGIDPNDRKPKLPSYLASRSFRNVVFDMTGLLDATGAGATSEDGKNDDGPSSLPTVQEVEALIANIPSKHLRDSLTTIWRSVDKDVNAFREGVERWFDRAMERVSGWYKRRAQLLLFFIGLAVAIVVNADAIRTADQLWKDDGVRAALVTQLGTQEPNPAADTVLDKLDDLGFPIGWGGNRTPEGWQILGAVAGWLITGIAVTFGAAFWFDFLGKVSNLRSSGQPPKSVLDDTGKK